jgi:hypothetical protein
MEADNRAMSKASPSVVKIEIPAKLHEFLQAFGERVVTNKGGKWTLARTKAQAAIAAVEADPAEQKRLLATLAAAMKELNAGATKAHGAPMPV